MTNRRVIASATYLAFGLAMFANSAKAIVIQPNNAASKDVFAYQGLPTFNFNSGGAASFEPILGAGIVSSSGGHSFESFLQFDLTGAPATVTNAKLELFVGDTAAVRFGANPSGAHPITVGIYKIGETWDPNVVTWNARPAVGGVLTTTAISGIGTYVSWDVTALVQSWMANPSSNFGLSLKAQAEVFDGSTQVGAIFNSAFGANAPKLTIVPEPSSVVFALFAVPALAWIGKRKMSRRNQTAR